LNILTTKDYTGLHVCISFYEEIKHKHRPTEKER